jgi:hypothetical protein
MKLGFFISDLNFLSLLLMLPLWLPLLLPPFELNRFFISMSSLVVCFYYYLLANPPIFLLPPKLLIPAEVPMADTIPNCDPLDVPLPKLSSSLAIDGNTF